MESTAHNSDKAEPEEEIRRILERVEQLLEKMLEQYRDEQHPAMAPPEDLPPNTTQRRPRALHRSALEWDFTDREVEIIHLLCHPAGYTYDVIAAMLGIHRGTLNGHLTRIFARMQVHNRSSVVRQWLGRHGIHGLQDEC